MLIRLTKKKYFFRNSLLPLLPLLTGCAADPSLLTSTTTSTTLADQTALAESLTGVHTIFNYSSFYTLTTPNPATRCAGDANTYYDPFVMVSSLPQPLQTSLTDSTTTIKPSFIKNISVDVTDANASMASNNAYSCSYGNGTGAPPVSNCATFDYGAIGGVPSSLGGSLIMTGGLSSAYNYNAIYPSNNLFAGHGLSVSCGPVLNPNSLSGSIGINSCPVSMYALSVNSLPASAAGTAQAPGLTSAPGPISMWYNMNTASTFSGPNGIAGATASYDPGLSKLLLFGGTAPLSGLGAQGYSATTYDTWSFSLSSQVWTYTSSTGVINPSMQLLWDQSSTVGATIQLSRTSGGRSSFGYLAVPGMALANLSGGTTSPGIGSVCQGLPSSSLCAAVDTTDRIITIGGIGSCTGGVCTDTHRFNPTYGPEYYDVSGMATTVYPSPSPSVGPPLSAPPQWVESYHTQLLSNSYPKSNYIPYFPQPSPFPSPSPPYTAIGFGAVALTNNSTAGVHTDSATGVSGTGYVLVGGGFNGIAGNTQYVNSGNLNIAQNGCGTNTTTHRNNCGGSSLFVRFTDAPGSSPAYSVDNELFTSIFGFATNFNDGGRGEENNPGQWRNLVNTQTSDLMPWLGGASMHQGFSKLNNDVVVFGGSDCKYYLTGPTSQCTVGSTTTALWPYGTVAVPSATPTFAANAIYNQGLYFSMSSNPAGTYANSTGFPTPFSVSTTWPTGGPINAGMASARGVDLNGNPVIVAWGGMSNVNQADSTGKIYFIYNNGTKDSALPSWSSVVPTGTSPNGLGNASLVFSHVTGKFYLYGGYNPLSGTRGDIWELSMSSSTPDCGTRSTCTFSWRMLNADQGLQCYPSCPPSRRSHRMVEVNYNNISGTNEPSCPSNHPCSFALFMEGGSPDGTANLADRWIFDPTANGGSGLWLEASEFPPRTLAQSAAADYSPTSNSNTVHRTVLFGGETGMQNPSAIGMNGSGGVVQRNGYFVPPTLGDTWMYSHDTGSWNRVTLYGQRYNTVLPCAGSGSGCISETLNRASADANPNKNYVSSVYAPPPTSGGVMVTRTLAKAPNHLATDTSSILKIPEIFLIGGRGKDGSYRLLNRVYKFCAGSTGEKPGPSYATAYGVNTGADDASCDAYDAGTNPASQSPSAAYVGSWMSKFPQAPTAGSYLGAGAYDSVHDLIIIHGGLTPDPSYIPSASLPTAKVTDVTQQKISANVYEYTPPSAVEGTFDQYHGIWNTVSSCSGSTIPAPRYGHSMGYDAFKQSLVISGGFDITGTALVYQGMPEVWTGYRVDQPLPNGNTALNIPSITQGNFPCYFWNQITTFGNSTSTVALTAPTTGISHASSVYIPTSGYNTGFYTTSDENCVGSGPVSTTDSSISKLLVGGVYLDIDRSQLGATENLLLNVTLLPLGPQNENPDHSEMTSAESAVFKVHLVSTGQSATALMQQLQPRNLAYANTDRFPEIVQSLSILSPPTGQVRQEQIVIPLAANPTIDRIRIERYSGSAILINASLFRMFHQ